MEKRKKQVKAELSCRTIHRVDQQTKLKVASDIQIISIYSMMTLKTLTISYFLRYDY